MNDKEIRKWYADHGVEYIPEDWGARGNKMNFMGTSMPSYILMLEEEGRAKPLWPQRGDGEREYVLALEDFFAPYIALLPRPKGNLIEEYMGMRRTQADLARSEHVSQQAVSKAMKAALRSLTRLIAKDDPEYVPPQDGRRRDFEGERAAAMRVFVRWYLSRDLPGTTGLPG